MEKTAENSSSQPVSREAREYHNAVEVRNAPTESRRGNTGHGQAQPPASGTTDPQNLGQSINSTNAANSSKEVAGNSYDNTIPITNTRSRRDRPCDGCRRRKSRCVLNFGSTICILCNFHNQPCTFVQSPQPRKKRVPVDHTGADNKKDHDRGIENRDADGLNPKGRESGTYSHKRFDIFLIHLHLISPLLFIHVVGPGSSAVCCCWHKLLLNYPSICLGWLVILHHYLEISANPAQLAPSNQGTGSLLTRDRRIRKILTYMKQKTKTIGGCMIGSALRN